MVGRNCLEGTVAFVGEWQQVQCLDEWYLCLITYICISARHPIISWFYEPIKMSEAMRHLLKLSPGIGLRGRKLAVNGRAPTIFLLMSSFKRWAKLNIYSLFNGMCHPMCKCHLVVFNLLHLCLSQDTCFENVIDSLGG